MFYVGDFYNDLLPVEVKHFPDGSLHLNGDFFPVRQIYWLYENDEEIFTLICLKRHFDQLNGSIRLILPYLPHARMDRTKTNKDVFTLKYFAEVINSLNFEAVKVLDAHSNVSLALVNNIVNVDPTFFVEKAINDILSHTTVDNLVLFFPDEGAMKRYSGLFARPYTFGMKKRDWETGEILGLDIVNPEAVKEKEVLIVDDICSYGGTFYRADKALREAGAYRTYLYVSHLENSVINGKLYQERATVNHIYTTNSIFNEDNDVDQKVTVFPVFSCEELYKKGVRYYQ
jgi:ribose-phosphate pyrophosphokinase